MSLRIWLPLLNDTNNQGLSDVVVGNTNAVVDTSGKLGSCYKFNTYPSYLSLSTEVLKALTTEFSMSFWVNITSWDNNYATLFQAGDGTGYAWNNYIFGVLRNGDTSKLCFTISNRTNFSGSSYLTPDLSLNTWYHLTLIYKTGHCLIYVNGMLYQDYETNIVPSFSNIATATIGISNNKSNYQSKCKMNDFRLYDHALSPKEVKELSKGLVCHYPLSGNGRGGNNLLKNSGDLTLWSNEGGITTTWDADKGLYKVVGSTHTSSRWGIYQDINVEANTTYTITCTLNGDNCAVAFGFYNSSDISFPRNLITVTDNTTKRLSYTVTSDASSIKARIYLNINCANSSTKTAWFGLPKVEKGSIATPWIPNSSDIEYTKMGYDSTTEYDVSGYNYHGTRNGTFTWDSNTARYSVSTVFNGNDNAIQIPFYQMLGLSAAGKTDYTISVWTYKTVIGTKGYQTILGGPGGFELEARDIAATDPLYRLHNWGGGTAAYEFGKWTLFTFVHTTSDCKLYVNGELKITGSSANVPIGNYFIGSWNVYNSQNYDGQMSDFRIYATALSADDVKELYDTVASITNNGTLLTRGEFVESTISSPQVTKAGLVNTEEIVESETTTSFSKTDIKSNEFIEI